MYFFFKKKTKESLINIGTGNEKKIIDYVNFLKKKMNFNGKIVFDKSKPDGTMKKVVDVQIANSYGWKSKISLSKGFDLTYKDFLEKFERH